MAFPVSPGVVTTENDLTTIAPGVDVTVGAYAGLFRWGPVYERFLIDTEDYLGSIFGTPTNYNAEGWFSAANFLAYSGALQVVRCANTTDNTGVTGVLSAMANTAPVTNPLGQMVINENAYTALDGTFDTNLQYVARYPGALGNSLRVAVCDTANAFSSTLNLASYGTGATFAVTVGSNTATFTITATSNTSANVAALALSQSLSKNDLLVVGNSSIGSQSLKLTNIKFNPATDVTGNTTSGVATISLGFQSLYRLAADFQSVTSMTRLWEFYDLMDQPPTQTLYVSQNGNTAAQDELHVVIVDDGGAFTGVSGTVLEVYKAVSRASDAIDSNGESLYYKTVINTQSRYAWLCNDRGNAVSANAALVASSTNLQPLSINFAGGSDGADESTVPLTTISKGYDMFVSPEDVDIGLIIAGKARGGSMSGQLANYIIDNICSIRKDCVVFISPDYSLVVNNVGFEDVSVVAFRNTLRSSSYGFLDSGYKYMYDKYNNVYRAVPLNGDMAGLAARTDATNDAWWSPAGFNRGFVKNLVKLTWSPRQAQRDLLYKNGVNPVVTFVGDGTVLLGDKTLLAKPSAFDRINVRRLFIVLEKSISKAARYSLFEFNDPFTRSQFLNLVTPFLRDVKGRRGITDFLVVCDETNNPGSVVDRNEFVGDLYIKPARSINFIQLNFNAVGTAVDFSTVVGQTGVA